MKDTYKRISGLEFGQQLCVTGDLDPVYTYALALSVEQRRRFVFAYLMFYHAGIATLLSVCKTTGEFADVFTAICRQTGGARGGERRHFRGIATHAVLADLKWRSEHFGWDSVFGDTAVLPLVQTVVLDFNAAYVNALSYPSVGSWLAFKTADMIERCDLLHPAAEGFWSNDANQCNPYWYDQPRMGLQLIYGDTDCIDGKLTSEHDKFRSALLNILQEMRVAPCGLQSRALNQQEVETICCKYKSHLKGTYQVGKDIKHLYDQLNPQWLEKEPTHWYDGFDASYVLARHLSTARAAINSHINTKVQS